MSGRRRGCLPRLGLVAASVGVLLLALVVGGGIAFAWRQAAIDTRGEVDFERPLTKIPPLDEGGLMPTAPGCSTWTARAGRTDLGGDRPSQTWGFNGAYLGPTLRAHRGERVAVNVTNDLACDHQRALARHAPPGRNGRRSPPGVAPGTDWRPTWTVDQPGATLWYHPHPHGETADQVSRGLAGMLILTDEEEGRLALPRDYGVDDLPVVVQDKDVRGMATSAAVGPHHRGQRHPRGVCRGVHQRVRLRVRNASSMRVMNFGLDDGAAFAMVASDGGLLPKPFTTTHIRLSPGERAELVVTMRPGETRVLQSVQPDLEGNFLSDHFDGGAASFDVLQLRAAPSLQPGSRPVPATLFDRDPRDLRLARPHRRPTLVHPQRARDQRTVDGHEPGRLRADRGHDRALDGSSTRAGSSHSFHVHDVQLRVLSIDGAPPPAELSGLKDTPLPRAACPVPVAPALRRLRATPDHPYMVHCHLLQHEDQGMMAQLTSSWLPASVPATSPARTLRPGPPHGARVHGG